MLPQIINIGGKSINVLFLISVIGVICWFFVLWYESKKDGFNTNRFFDLTFLSLILCSLSCFGLYKLLGWLKIYYPSNIILSLDEETFLGVTGFIFSLIPILFLTKKFKWSTFRVLDIYSMAFCILIWFFSLGKSLIFVSKEYIMLSFLLLFIYLGVMRYRGYKFISGAVFSIFLVALSLSFATFMRKPGYIVFGSILVTLSMINLYLRSKKNMTKISMPKQFMMSLKDKLMSKEKKLNEEQKALIRDDPYLQNGREVDNAESLDEVMEDTGKTITDARMGIVRSMKIQVRKALAALKLGRYGRCEVCGKPIDLARLKAYPEATTCIECATDASQAEEVKEDKMLEENL